MVLNYNLIFKNHEIKVLHDKKSNAKLFNPHVVPLK